MKNVLISTSSFAQHSLRPLKLLESKNFNFTKNDKGRKLTKDEVIKIISNYHYVIAGTEEYDLEVLNNAKNLKVISRVGVGLDNIDLEEAFKKNIKVFKTETNPSMAVVELTLGLILDLYRKISQQNQDLKNNKWKKQMGSLINGKTLGIIGLGSIGKTLVKITKGFRLKYLAFDSLQDNQFAKQNNIEYCSLNKLLSQSDIVTIHLSLNKKNKSLINYEKIKKMKHQAILINTSRGEILDEVGLVNALNERLIAGAGLDVFNDEPYKGDLQNFNNVIMTPHIGAYAVETRIAMECEAVQNLFNEVSS